MYLPSSNNGKPDHYLFLRGEKNGIPLSKLSYHIRGLVVEACRWLTHIASFGNAWMISSLKLLWSTQLTVSSWNIYRAWIFQMFPFWDLLICFWPEISHKFVAVFLSIQEKHINSSSWSNYRDLTRPRYGRDIPYYNLARSSNTAIPFGWWTELQSKLDFIGSRSHLRDRRFWREASRRRFAETAPRRPCPQTS